MLLLPWFVCCFAEPSEVSPFFFYSKIVPSEKIVLDISWEVVSPGSLSLAACFAVLQEGTRLPFLEPFIMDPFMPGPTFGSTLLLWLCLLTKLLPDKVSYGDLGDLESTGCPAHPQAAPGCSSFSPACSILCLQCCHPGRSQVG